MKREAINEKDLTNVVGGTILFTSDHSTCGYFCNDQYEVNDYDACMDFIHKNSGKMSERSMLNKMEEKGYISSL